MESKGTLRILGTITHIGDARVWNNGAYASYAMTFSGEGNEFYGEMYTNKSTMEKRGIKVGAIGHMDIAFTVYRYERNGDMNAMQRVTFKQFTLANAGVFTDNVPAASQQAAPQPVKVDTLPANEPEGNLPF